MSRMTVARVGLSCSKGLQDVLLLVDYPIRTSTIVRYHSLDATISGSALRRVFLICRIATLWVRMPAETVQ